MRMKDLNEDTVMYCLTKLSQNINITTYITNIQMYKKNFLRKA